MKTYITYNVDANTDGLVEADYGEWSNSMNHSGYIDITDDVEDLYNHLQSGDEVYVCIEGTYSLYKKEDY